MKMEVRRRFVVLLWGILFWITSDSCSATINQLISLTSFTENDVDVSIYLEHDASGKSVLSATFTPPEGYHLYSKDIPKTGVNGLGRPTLLELTANSQIMAVGDLRESIRAQKPDFEPEELLVYPLGAVTLTLPVRLPPGNSWIDDEITVTYMACRASQCKPPVVEKIVSIRIPGAEVIRNK